MTIKDIIFFTSQQLKHAVEPKIKKTHLYELYAAAFGFNTYAALNSKFIFIMHEKPPTISSFDVGKLVTRCAELGYVGSTAKSISEKLSFVITHKGLAVLELNELILALRIDDYGSDFDDESAWRIPPGDKSYLSEVLGEATFALSSLEQSAASGNCISHYALALIHLNGGAWNGKPVSDFWFKQHQIGKELNAVEMEFAYAYEKQFQAKEKSVYHLKESARLGNEMALLDLAEYFDDPLFFETSIQQSDEDPMRVALIAEHMGRKEDVHHWLIVAAEAGNTRAMSELITNYEKDNLTRCWMWIYLSKLVNHDLTVDRYFAMHDDGSDYDDDVGGAVEVGGEEGIILPDIDTHQNQIATQGAEELFRKMRLSRIQVISPNSRYE